MSRCRNHPEADSAAACTHCAFLYCGSCLVELLGEPHCANCREARLALMLRERCGPDYGRLRQYALTVAMVLLVGIMFTAPLGRQFSSAGNSPQLQLWAITCVLGLIAVACCVFVWAFAAMMEWRQTRR